MFEYYRKDSDYKSVYDLFFSLVTELGKDTKEIEIQKIGDLVTPTSKEDIIPSLINLYMNNYAVNNAVSKILKIRNFSEEILENSNEIVVSDKYLIYNNVIYFTNPLSLESSNIIKAIEEYDHSELLFSEYGIIQKDQIEEIKNKMQRDSKHKNHDLDDLSISKIFQDILKIAIENNASQIKFFKEDNLVKCQFKIDNDFIKDKEIVISEIINYSSIKESIEKKFLNNLLSWKYFNNYYKINYKSEDEIIYFDINNLNGKVFSIDDINLNSKDIELLKASLKSPSGVIVISGSKNSGKRSALYSCLNYMKSIKPGINIITYENFIKVSLSNVLQVEKKSLNYEQVENYSVISMMDNGSNMTEAFSLASEGKLVFFISNSNSIFNTINKVYNSTSDKNLIAENLLCILNMGLIKQICDSCSSDQIFYKLSDSHFFIALENAPNLQDTVKVESLHGCSECYHGYKGRIQVAELAENDSVLKDIILGSYSLKKFKVEKRSKSWRSHHESSMELLKEGKVSLDSIIQSIGYFKK